MAVYLILGIVVVGLLTISLSVVLFKEHREGVIVSERPVSNGSETSAAMSMPAVARVAWLLWLLNLVAIVSLPVALGWSIRHEMHNDFAQGYLFLVQLLAFVVSTCLVCGLVLCTLLATEGFTARTQYALGAGLGAVFAPGLLLLASVVGFALGVGHILAAIVLVLGLIPLLYVVVRPLLNPAAPAGKTRNVALATVAGPLVLMALSFTLVGGPLAWIAAIIWAPRELRRFGPKHRVAT